MMVDMEKVVQGRKKLKRHRYNIYGDSEGMGGGGHMNGYNRCINGMLWCKQIHRRISNYTYDNSGGGISTMVAEVMEHRNGGEAAWQKYYFRYNGVEGQYSL